MPLARHGAEEGVWRRARVLNCCIHLGRNIKQNTGPNSELLSRFWAMRQQRTKESEDSFVDSLRRLHAARPSHFTTSLLNSLDAFLPSKTDCFLKRPMFSAVVEAKRFELTACCPSTPHGIESKLILAEIQSVDDVYENVHSRDNTNTIEGFFSIIKRRVKRARQHSLTSSKRSTSRKQRPLLLVTLQFQASRPL